MAGIPDKTIIFRKFDIWWPLLTSIFTWAKKWPKGLRSGSLRADDRRIARLSSFPSFRVRGGGGHFGPPTMAKVAETATRARVKSCFWAHQNFGLSGEASDRASESEQNPEREFETESILPHTHLLPRRLPRDPKHAQFVQSCPVNP